MQPADLQYLNGAFDSFANAGLQRVPNSGRMTHTFTFSAEDFKKETGRSRLHESIINEVLGFFANKGASAEYNSTFGSFNVHIDLEMCILNPDQSKFLSHAIESYRAEFGS